MTHKSKMNGGILVSVDTFLKKVANSCAISSLRVIITGGFTINAGLDSEETFLVSIGLRYGFRYIVSGLSYISVLIVVDSEQDVLRNFQYFKFTS